ncbi:inositol monophosphatase family protein [Micromonospora sp. CP22]|uniref:inositol monophosphatase family protein n=1 Tax=Micromonospora sp. CP22 TaxID=2580517 RepID=UPI0028165B68|nr:inositol monophosphatase family protein [Micromonospora sp. CP22]
MILTDAEVAIAAAFAGTEVVVRDYGADHVRFAKSATDFATGTDLEAEAAIVRVLTRHRPADSSIGEETGGSGSGAARRRWLIDPLCGTVNFAATTPLVAVNVALLQDGIGCAAACADPIAGEVFWTDGSAAYLRAYGKDRPLAPSAASGLIEINCDGPLDRPFVGGQLVHDPQVRGAYGHRVISSTLGRGLGSSRPKSGIRFRWHLPREPPLRGGDRHRRGGRLHGQRPGGRPAEHRTWPHNLGRRGHTPRSTGPRRAPPRSSQQSELTLRPCFPEARPSMDPALVAVPTAAGDEDQRMSETTSNRGGSDKPPMPHRTRGPDVLRYRFCARYVRSQGDCVVG